MKKGTSFLGGVGAHYPESGDKVLPHIKMKLNTKDYPNRKLLIKVVECLEQHAVDAQTINQFMIEMVAAKTRVDAMDVINEFIHVDWELS
jgi:hypothetical protein